MNRTKIDWATHRWNPVIGCTGTCPYCYARKMAHRFHRDFTPHWVEKAFQNPAPKEPGARIFVNSMSDVAQWEPLWLSRVDMKMRKHPEHTFLMLTKNPEKLGWYNRPPNVLLGFSCTDQESYLSASFQVADGTVQFVSIEPLLGEIDMEEMTCGQTLRWIIVGAETGNRKERVVPKFTWLMEIRDFALMNSIPLFFKGSLRPFWTVDNFPQGYPV
jgi:protein gp37